MPYYSDYVWDSQGNIVPRATITVYDQNGSPATLWTNAYRTNTQSNPTSSDVYGSYSFYVSPGVYTILAQFQGFSRQQLVEIGSAGIESFIDFGGSGSSADNSAALIAAYNALSDGNSLYFPATTYNFTTAISLGNKRLAYNGDGARQTIFNYSGSITSSDCFTWGNGTTGVVGMRINGIGFSANTTMTGGAGVKFNGLQRSVLSDVLFDHQDGNGNFYHGVWFNGCDFVVMDKFQARAQQDALRVNGDSVTGLADIIISNFKIALSTVGIRIGGNFGGFFADACDIILNKTNVVIDKTLSASNNREMFFGPTCAIDGASNTLNGSSLDGVNVNIQDTDGFVFFNNTWNASCGTNIRVISSFAGMVKLDGGFLYNSFTSSGGNGRGIDNGSASSVVILNGTRFKNIQSTAIWSNVATTNFVVNNPSFASDVVAKIAANVSTVGQLSSGVTLYNYANDAAAAAAGVPIGGFYRTTNAVQQRIA